MQRPWYNLHFKRKKKTWQVPPKSNLRKRINACMDDLTPLKCKEIRYKVK
jgi:hypothetical protein